MKTTIIAIIVAATLSACGSMPPGKLRPYADSPDPVLDMKTVDAAKLASYDADLKECRLIQERSMPLNFLEEFGSNDVMGHKQRKADKASTIIRNCLQGRGYSVLY